MRPFHGSKLRVLALAGIVVMAQCCCLIFPIRWQRSPRRQLPMLQQQELLGQPLEPQIRELAQNAIFFIQPPARPRW